MTAALFGVRLRPDGAGGIEALGLNSRAQLARLRADRDTFALLVGAFGAVDVVVRPTTPISEPEPPSPVWVRPLPTRRPWSGRTA